MQDFSNYPRMKKKSEDFDLNLVVADYHFLFSYVYWRENSNICFVKQILVLWKCFKFRGGQYGSVSIYFEKLSMF